MGLKFPNPVHRKVIALCVVFLAIIFSPLITSVTIGLWWVRSFLNFWKKKFKPHLGEFLCGTSAMLAVDSPYDKKTMCSMTIYFIIEGNLELEKFRRSIQTAMDSFEASPELGRVAIFPKMKQFLTTFMSFSVWEREKKFQIIDHVNVFDETEINSRFGKNTTKNSNNNEGQKGASFEHFKILKSDQEIAQLATDLIRLPYKEGKSPWEILIHSDVHLSDGGGGKKQSVLFFRFHHALADGLSGVFFISKLLDEADAYQKSFCTFSDGFTQAQKESGGLKGVYKFWRDIFGIHGYVSHVLNTWDETPWNLHPIGSVRFDHRPVPIKFPMETMRKIMKEHGRANFVSVVIAVLTAAIRRYLKCHAHVDVPNEMHTAVTVGVPRDPNKMTNDYNIIFVKMPTGLNHRDQIIKAVEEDYVTQKESSYSGFLLRALSFIGQFPRCLIPFGNSTCSCITTNVPSFEKAASFAGAPIISTHGVGYVQSDFAIGLFCAVAHDVLTFNAALSNHIFTSVEDAAVFRRYIQTEFVAFQHAGAGPANSRTNCICPEVTV